MRNQFFQEEERRSTLEYEIRDSYPTSETESMGIKHKIK